MVSLRGPRESLRDMTQLIRPPIPTFVVTYGPEFARHILIALVAFLLAIPVRHAQDALVRLAHGGQSRAAIAQLWPSRGAVPVGVLR